MRVVSYYINCLLIVELLPKTIRSKYEEQIMRFKLMHWNFRIRAQYRPCYRLRKAESSTQGLPVKLSSFEIHIPNRSRNLQKQCQTIGKKYNVTQRDTLNFKIQELHEICYRHAINQMNLPLCMLTSWMKAYRNTREPHWFSCSKHCHFKCFVKKNSMLLKRDIWWLTFQKYMARSFIIHHSMKYQPHKVIYWLTKITNTFANKQQIPLITYVVIQKCYTLYSAKHMAWLIGKNLIKS